MKRTMLSLILALVLFATCFATAEEPVHLKALVENGVLVDDPMTGPCYEAIVGLTGYALDMEVYSSDQAETKIYMALSSEEAYDYVRGASISQLFKMIENNAVAPLDDLIDEYAPELKAAFSEDVWNAIKINGHIYFIPSTAMPRLWNGIVIRTDWLEALDMDMPETTEGVLDYLRAIKAEDPGKIGADRLIPFATSMFSGKIDDDPFLSAFNITYQWNERDGKLVNRIELPEYKEWLSFYRTMYEEGLLDIDIAVNKDSTLMEKMNKGIVGMARYPWNMVYQTRDIWEKENPDWKIDFIKAPIGPEGAQGIQIENGLSYRCIIPASSEKAADVVKYANEFIKNYENLMIGVEGVTWKYENGVRVPILPAFNEQRGDTFWYQPVSVGDIEYPLWLMRVYKLPSMGKAYSDEMAAYDGAQRINPIANAINLPVTNGNKASLESIELSYVLRIIVGELPLEAVEDLRAEWNAKGGEESTAEVNEWYAQNH